MPEQSNNFLESLGRILSTGSRASSSLAAGLMGQDPGQWWSSGKTYTDLVREQFPDMNSTLQNIVGLAADIGLDPLTYTGFGATTKLAEGGKGARALLSFAGKPIIEGRPVIEGVRKIARAGAETDAGRWIAKKFGSGELLRDIHGLKPAYNEFQGEIGKGFVQGQRQKQKAMDIYLRGNFDDEANLKIWDELEQLPEDTKKMFGGPRQVLKQALGKEGDEIYQMANLQREDYFRTMAAAGYPMEEIQAKFYEKFGIGYFPHIKKKPFDRSEIKFIKSVGGAENLGGPASLLHRIRKGTMREIDEEFGRQAYEEYLPNVLGYKATEMVHAKAKIDYAKKIAKQVGVVKSEAPAGFAPVALGRDPYDVFQKIFTGTNKAGTQEALWIPKELQSEVAKFAKGLLGMDQFSGSLLAGFDWVTNLFRRTTLYPFPGFYFRNAVSNMWNSHLVGVTGVDAYAAAGKAKSFMKRLRDGALQEGDEELYQMAMAHGVIDQGRVATEMGRIPNSLKESWIDGNWNPLSQHFKPLNIGAWSNKQIENHWRLTHWMARLGQGWDYNEAAMDMMKALPGGTARMSEFEKNVMRRVIPFYSWCVPTDHEILTRRGFRKHHELIIGEDVLGYEHETGEYHWTPLLEVAEFDHDDELLTFNRRGYEFAFTKDHRWPVVEGRHFVKGKWYGGKRKIVRAYELNQDHKIPLTGEFNGKESILSVRHATILGWVIGDGYHRWRGNHCEMMVYQSPKKYLKEIIELLGTNPRKPHPQTNVVCVPVSLDDSKEILKVFKSKSDLPNIVCQLSRESAEAMWQAIFKAEGWTNPESGESGFGQSHKNEDVIDAFQILSIMTGRLFKVGKGCNHYIRKGRFLRVKEGIGVKQYKGKIWCPVTKYGTWVMRHDGAVIITGNTRGNLPLQIEMMIERPGKFANLSKTLSAVSAQFGPPPAEKWMGDYLKENGSQHLWRSENGQTQYFLMRNWIPTYDLLTLEDPLNDIFSMVNPLPKEALQQFFNYDTFFKKQITRQPKDFNPVGGELGNFVGQTLNQRLIHLMRNVRLLSELDRINPMGMFGTDRPHHAKDSAGWEKGLMAMGLKLYPYDPEKAKAQWMRDFGEKLQALKGQITYAKRRGYATEAARYEEQLRKEKRNYQEFIAQ